MNKKMLGAISAVALTMGTAGCSTPPTDNTNKPVQVGQNSKTSNSMKECKNMELVQGDAYSGKDKEVWYCGDDDNDDRDSHFSGMFFYPMTGQYYDSNTLKSKHKVDVSTYKPGTSTKKVSVSEYNKAAKLKLPAYQPKQSVKSTTTSKTTSSGYKKPSSSSISNSTKTKSSSSSSFKSSTSSSKGFGSSFSSSGG